MADYGIVGDLTEVPPILSEEFRKLKQVENPANPYYASEKGVVGVCGKWLFLIRVDGG